MAHEFNIQYWQLSTDSVRTGVAANDTQLQVMLLYTALSDRMEFSKCAMAIGSTTANKGGCEVFFADLDNSSAYIAKAWTEIGSTTVGGPNEVTADMLSKIWTISH